MPTPTPPGNPMPPPSDVVPVPQYLRDQYEQIDVDNSGTKTDRVDLTRPGVGQQKVEVSSVAAVYILGYQRGWSDSGAHYWIDEHLKSMKP